MTQSASCRHRMDGRPWNHSAEKKKAKGNLLWSRRSCCYSRWEIRRGWMRWTGGSSTRRFDYGSWIPRYTGNSFHCTQFHCWSRETRAATDCPHNALPIRILQTYTHHIDMIRITIITITTITFLRTYTGCRSVNEWSSRRSWWSGSVSMVLLQSSLPQRPLRGLEVCSRCCSSLPQRPLHTCRGHVCSREDALCVQSNESYRVCMATTAGQRSSAVNGPTTWNSLAPALRASELSQNAFIHALKTHLFSSVRHRWDFFTRFRRGI